MKKFTWILAALMATTLLLSACTVAPATSGNATAADASAATQAASPSDATDAAADATATPKSDGSLSFSIDTLNGGTLDQSVFSDHKLVMVNYWATWCGPCVGEIPDLVKINNAYADKGFTIIGVLTGDDDIKGAQTYMESENMTYPVVLPEAFFGDQAAGIYAIPTTMFFDSTGKQVGDTIVGAMSYVDWASTIDEKLEQVS